MIMLKSKNKSVQQQYSRVALPTKHCQGFAQ